MSELPPQAIENFWATLRETLAVLRESDPRFHTRIVGELNALETTTPTSLPYPEPLPKAG